MWCAVTFAALAAARLALAEPEPQLTLDTINPSVIKMEYAVRGEIMDRAEELQVQLDAGDRLPFDKIVACNIGNPQALGQKPLSYNRQVLSLVTNTAMLDDPEMRQMFPEDVIARAENYRGRLGGGVGQYSGSQGVQVVREEVAKFIEARDAVAVAAAPLTPVSERAMPKSPSRPTHPRSISTLALLTSRWEKCSWV